MSHKQHQQLIDALQDCIVACNHCYDACLKEEDIKMMAGCIRLDRECAEICSYLAQALCRDTPFAAELAAVCSNICEACGNECKQHDHEHCQKCADACFQCAKACNSIA